MNNTGEKTTLKMLLFKISFRKKKHPLNLKSGIISLILSLKMSAFTSSSLTWYYVRLRLKGAVSVL